MHPSLTLIVALAVFSSLVPAAERMPNGLPHETVVLEDGRTFVGHYDEAQGVLWIDGPGSPRLRVLPQQVRSRTSVVAERQADARSRPSVALPTPVPQSLPSQQNAIVDLERQLTDLERRMDETQEDIKRVSAFLQEWLKVYAKAERIAQENPGTGLGWENNASYNLTKIRSEIQAVRTVLTRHEETFDRQSARRTVLLSSLREARQALATTTPATNTAVVVVHAAPPTTSTTDVEERLRALELQIATLRQDNEILRTLLEAATRPPAIPAPAPAQRNTTDALVAVFP